MFYWIYAANIRRKYVILRVSVGPSGRGLGNVLGDEFVLNVACPQRRLSSTSPVLNVAVLNVAVLNVVSSTLSVLNVP